MKTLLVIIIINILIAVACWHDGSMFLSGWNTGIAMMLLVELWDCIEKTEEGNNE